MKAKKRLVSMLVCLAMVASLLMIPSFTSASAQSTQFDFDGETLNANVKSSSFTAGGGTTAQFMNGAAGTSVTIQNSDAVVPGNASSNKFLKFDYNGDAGAEVASRLQITPATPIKNDFVLEFDYALNCTTGTHADYSPYEGFVDLTFFPNVNDTSNMWKYGSKAVVIDQTYRVKTPKTDMINPEFWSGYNNYATGYTGNSGFATMKVVTRFVENDYPVYDVYVRIPGASSFTKVVTGKQYATSGYGGASLTAADYNTYGFKYINMDMITGRQATSRTSDRVLDAAIDNIKIYDYDPGLLSFDSEILNADVKASTITADDGTTAQFMNGATGTSVTVKNSDAIVPGNDSANKFIKYDYNGDAGAETASRLQITPASPIKEDFVLEFDYALNREGDPNGYAAYERFVDLTFYPNVNDTSNMWKYGSKAVVIDQTYRVKTPKTNMISPEFWSGYNNYATGYVGGSGFATMKIITRFIENDYPVYDVYVKIPGASDFTKLVDGKQYATSGYGGASLTAADYNTYGFKYINLDMITGEQASSRTSDRILDAAIDNIKIYPYDPAEHVIAPTAEPTAEPTQAPAVPDVTISFDSETLNADAKASTVTASGTTAQFMNGATGTSVTVKNSDAIVPGNDSANKFIKYDYNGDAGAETASRLQITPASPIKEDFVLEFDYALNREGDPNGYAAYERFVDLTFFPNVNDTSNMWKYGSRAVVIDQTYRVKTPKTDMISPEFWSGYNNYATGYVGGSGFATMKIVTRFIENDYPVYDVYVKIPGASDFTKLVDGKQYATSGYGGASITASDYNTDGFKYINLDMITGEQASSRTSDRILDAAIDNIKIYPYDPAEHVITPTEAPTAEPTAEPTQAPVAPTVGMTARPSASATITNAFYYVINVVLNDGTAESFTVDWYPTGMEADKDSHIFNISGLSGVAAKLISVLKDIPVGQESRSITTDALLTYTLGGNSGSVSATNTTSLNAVNNQ